MDFTETELMAIGLFGLVLYLFVWYIGIFHRAEGFMTQQEWAAAGLPKEVIPVLTDSRVSFPVQLF